MRHVLQSSIDAGRKIAPDQLKNGNESNQEDSLAVPSFNGKLNISDFTFVPPQRLRKDFQGKDDPGESSQNIFTEGQHETKTIRSSPRSKRKPDACLTGRSSPTKRIRSPSGYAPPSTYAHLPLLPDVISPNLICLFIGLNPGIRTAKDGHAYAHPSNSFWKLLHSSGCTTRRCRPEEDQDLPRLFSLGNTNIVARPTRNGSELSKEEMDASVHVLEDKIRRYKPEVVCTVGKSIWESIWRVKHGKPIRKEEFKYGWQSEVENMGRQTPRIIREGEGSWEGARVFVASSTSGLAASLLPAEKERIWKDLGVWVEKRRVEREDSEKNILS